MKKQVVYVADDGREFGTEAECKKYESSYSLVEYLASVLPESVDADVVADAIRSDLLGLRQAIKRMRSPRGSRKARAAALRQAEDNGSRESRSPF